MSAQKHTLGRWGESLAVEYLTEHGYKVIERNVYTPYGELDIVALQDEDVVFVEVKTRRTLSFGMPEESITLRKQEHLIEAAQAYLQEHPEFSGDWRIDVIAIHIKKPNARPDIRHIENAVS
ncbi:MAG: YraN family protein [Chloroflexota bacterium]